MDNDHSLNIINVCGRCNTIITDIMDAVKNGCPNCGARVFKAVKKDELKKQIGVDEKETISIDGKQSEIDEISSIEVSKDGVIMIDLDKLISGEELENIVVKDPEGKYHISLDALRKGKK